MAVPCRSLCGRSLLLLVCKLAYTCSDSSESWEASATRPSDSHSRLCLQAEGQDFLFTMHSSQEGCLLECVILTASDRYANYLLDTRISRHYLTGQACRDDAHVSN